MVHLYVNEHPLRKFILVCDKNNIVNNDIYLTFIIVLGEIKDGTQIKS